MTEMSERPDRFGCYTVGAVILMGVLAMVAILYIALGGGFQPSPPAGIEPEPAFGDPDIPEISDRFFSGGGVQTTVTGDLAFNLDLPLDDVRSYAQQGMGWIAFGQVIGDGTEPVVLVTFNEPENSVAVSQGAKTALGVDEQCTWDVTVTATLIAGHVSCPEADALDVGEVVGSVAIEMDFSAASGGSAPGGPFPTPPVDGD